MKKLTVEQIVNITDRLRGERGTFETHWQEVADYFIPNKAQITTKKYPGQQDAFQLLDNVGVHSNELLAGALHGLLTNTDAPWFEFTTGKLDLDNDDEIRMYFQQSVRVMHNVLSNSNFYVELHEMYLEMPSIGTGCFLTEEDDKDYVRFSAKPITDYLIDEDRRGNVNQVYNVYKCTARELITEFGKDKLPEKVVKCKNEGEKFCVIHAVYLENVADPVKGTTEIQS